MYLRSIVNFISHDSFKSNFTCLCMFLQIIVSIMIFEMFSSWQRRQEALCEGTLTSRRRRTCRRLCRRPINRPTQQFSCQGPDYLVTGQMTRRERGNYPVSVSTRNALGWPWNSQQGAPPLPVCPLIFTLIDIRSDNFKSNAPYRLIIGNALTGTRIVQTHCEQQVPVKYFWRYFLRSRYFYSCQTMGMLQV